MLTSTCGSPLDRTSLAFGLVQKRIILIAYGPMMHSKFCNGPRSQSDKLMGVMMPLEGIRDIFRESLGRSLQTLQEEDRVAAAWPVACGKAMAERGQVIGFQNGVVRVEVEDGAWLQQLMSMRRQLAAELALISGVRVSEIHFERKRNCER
jgi:hypothetical protein